MKNDIILSGVGGQGILSIAAVIGLAAVDSNLFLKQSEVHGMSQRGGIVEKENPLHVSNVQLVCGKCDRPVRVGRTQLADGQRVRVCRECGETMD